jgi:hypothetical protein
MPVSGYVGYKCCTGIYLFHGSTPVNNPTTPFQRSRVCEGNGNLITGTLSTACAVEGPNYLPKN